MPRIAYIIIFILVALIPMFFFSAMSGPSRGYSSNGRYYNDYDRGYYRSRRSSFFFFNSSGGSRGRGYSSGGYRGGGFRSGK